MYTTSIKIIEDKKAMYLKTNSEKKLRDNA